MILRWFFFLAQVRVLALLLLTWAVRAQEAPAFTTAKFETNITHRTNMCDRHASLVRDEIELPHALEGLNLSVVLTNYNSQDDPDNQELFSLTPEGVISEEQPPLFAVILDELALRARFEWRNSFGVQDPIDDGDTTQNRTWTDLLKWDVETYDIAFGRWDRTAQRLSMEISFPEGYMDSSIILVQLDRTKDLTWDQIWTFLLPFEPAVWWMILVALFLSGLLYFVLEKLDPSADDNNIEGDPGAAIYFSFITFTGHHEFNPRSPSARVLAFSMTFWGLITAAAYTANLASFLVSRSQPEITFHTIQEAAIVKTPICLQRGVAIDQYVSAKYPTGNLLRKRTGRLVFDGLNTGECEVAVVSLTEYEKFQRSTEVNENCNLWWSGRVEQYILSGLATKVDAGEYCTSLIDHVLDYHILQMKSDRFFERVMGDYFDRTGEISCPNDSDVALLPTERQDDDEDTRSLSLQEMSGIFIVHFLLCSLALLLAFGKFYVIRRKSVHSSVRRMFSEGSLRSLWISSHRADETENSNGGSGQEEKSQPKRFNKGSSSRSSNLTAASSESDYVLNLPRIPEVSDEQQCLVSFPSPDQCSEEEGKKSEGHASSFSTNHCRSASDRRLSV